MAKRITPTKAGTDADSTDGKYDAHVRLEEVDGEWLICVDIFDSTVRRANAAHLDSDSFPDTGRGAKEATSYLLEYGFDVRIVIRESSRKAT